MGELRQQASRCRRNRTVATRLRQATGETAILEQTRVPINLSHALPMEAMKRRPPAILS